MESALTKACTIKIQNFEGPFDLLFHLLEKNQINIYDIPINEITDQYMDYLFAMQKLDLEIASEFLVMAATLLHIKSKMLLPSKKEKEEQQETDPREELITKLLEYKKYKEFTISLKLREKQWASVFYKLPEVLDIKPQFELLNLDPGQLAKTYSELIRKNERKYSRDTGKMAAIIQMEKVSVRSKVREIIRHLLKNSYFKFSELYSLAKKSKAEVVTGFLAVLELAKLNKVVLEQKNSNDDITIYKKDKNLKSLNDSEIAVEN